MVVEDIEPLNDEDPGVVPASITAVADVDRNLPFTTLGEGDNKVSMFFCCGGGGGGADTHRLATHTANRRTRLPGARGKATPARYA